MKANGKGKHTPRKRQGLPGSKVARGRPEDKKPDWLSRTLLNMLVLMGYFAGTALILQTTNGWATQPAFGFNLSPAVLGVVVLFVAALAKNEWGLRDRLSFFDPKGPKTLALSVSWGLLAVVAMAAIFTLPRF